MQLIQKVSILKLSKLLAIRGNECYLIFQNSPHAYLKSKGCLIVIRGYFSPLIASYCWQKIVDLFNFLFQISQWVNKGRIAGSLLDRSGLCDPFKVKLMPASRENPKRKHQGQVQNFKNRGYLNPYFSPIPVFSNN